jgi:hypothetical protein
MQKMKKRQQKQKEQNADAEIAACKGSRSSRSNILYKGNISRRAACK